MSRSRKVRLLGMLALVLVSMNVFWLQPISSYLGAQVTRENASPVEKTSSLSYNKYANGPYTVQGNSILGSDGKTYCFMVLGAIVWSMTVKGMDFLMPNILHIWVLAPIHPAERTGMPTLSDFHLARATGSMDNLLNNVLPLSIKVS